MLLFLYIVVLIEFTIINICLCDIQLMKSNIQKVITFNPIDLPNQLQLKKFPLSWKYTNEPPFNEEVIKFTFTLCSGPSYAITSFAILDTIEPQLIKHDVNGIANIDLMLKNTFGTDGFYYIQVYSLTKTGYTIHYSQKFEMRGMIGNKKADQNLADNKLFNKDDPGEIDDQMGDRKIYDGPPSEIILNTVDIIGLPYGKQHGDIKYAPMQTQPGSKITRRSWSRINPTSKVTYFNAWKEREIDGRLIVMKPAVKTTITPVRTYKTDLEVNWVKPALNPIENGKAYHPSNRIKKPMIIDTEKSNEL